jgi:hypothetical protein
MAGLHLKILSAVRERFYPAKTTPTTDTIHGPVFPPEICDAILDQVCASNVKSRHRTELLGACSLVSRSWLQRSRRHLFERITVDPLKQKKIMRLLDSPLDRFAPSNHICKI